MDVSLECALVKKKRVVFLHLPSDVRSNKFGRDYTLDCFNCIFAISPNFPLQIVPNDRTGTIIELEVLKVFILVNNAHYLFCLGI